MANNKLTVYAWAALAGTFLLAGCSRDEGPDPGDGNVPVSFSASRHTVIAGSLSRSEPSTRTTNSGNEWLGTDEVGIFMLSTGGSLTAPGDILNMEGTSGSGTPAANLKFTATPGSPASTATFTPDTGTPALYYPQSGNVDFIAYYPHGEATPGSTTAGEVNSTDYTYNISVAAQNTEDEQNALDVLYAKTTDVAKSKTAVGLEFDHVMSKITLLIEAGEGFMAANIEAMAGNDIKFGGMPLTATMNLNDGTVTAGATGDFSPLKGTVPGGSTYNATFTAILVPQAAHSHSGRTVTFTVDGQPYVWNMPDTDAFAAGNHYSYPVTVNKTGVSVGQATITAWDEMSPEAGDTERAVIQPEANSYMVAPGGLPILIPVSQANKAADTAYNLGAESDGLGGVAAGNFTVELVWGDRPVGVGEVIAEIKPEGEYVFVRPGSKAGNIVIAIRDKDSDNIKWSWHIWVTEPVDSGTDGVTGLTWMDRNLGAMSNTPYVDDRFDNDQWVKTLGLFYQWGRKDAFPKGDGTKQSQTYFTPAFTAGSTNDLTVEDINSLSEMVKKPFVFSNSSAMNFSGSAGSESWGADSTKTIYDPCPPGWRVPPIEINNQGVWFYTNSSWGGLLDGGRIFNGMGSSALGHYYPAGGCRDLTGKIIMSHQGTYWSSSNDIAVGAYRLSFYTGVNWSNRYSRVAGSFIRCVKNNF